MGITYSLHCNPKCALCSDWISCIAVVEEHFGDNYEFLWTQCLTTFTGVVCWISNVNVTCIGSLEPTSLLFNSMFVQTTFA